jgi:hypothetical protein
MFKNNEIERMKMNKITPYFYSTEYPWSKEREGCYYIAGEVDSKIEELERQVEAQTKAIFEYMEMDAEHHNRALIVEAALGVALETLNKIKNQENIYSEGCECDEEVINCLNEISKIRGDE